MNRSTIHLPISGKKCVYQKLNTLNLWQLQMIAGIFILLLCHLMVQVCSQSLSLMVNLTTQQQNVSMVVNGQPQPLFIATESTFDCSLPPLFSYAQNTTEYMANAPYSIVVSGLSQPNSFSISTVYQYLNPTLNQTSCQSSSCIISMQNNCHLPSVNFFNYFDEVIISIQNGGQTIILNYYVICNDEYLSSTFQWGLLIEIVFITILTAIVAVYSRAWSFRGMGITIRVWLIVLFNVLLIIGGLVGFYSQDGITVILKIVSFVLGILGVTICCNQILFLLRSGLLRTHLVTLGQLQLHIQQIVSLLVGVALTLGWYFSSKNIIMNDIVCCCMIVGFIKILKFTSLKITGLCFLVTMAVQMTFVITIHFQVGVSYNDIFLNNFNFPIQLQFPTINPVYNQKCAWLPFSAIVFPGMMLSYLRRFDVTRNSNVYLITSTSLFFLGSIAWMFISIFNPFTFPLGLVSQPCMFGLVCLFAYRRRELRVLWDGKFFDEEFADRQDLRHAIELISGQRQSQGVKIPEEILQGLRGSRDSNRSNLSSQKDVVRSKSLKTGS